MFTGIIDHCGEIIAKKQGADQAQFDIRCEFHDLVEGESIAVDGVCLTAIQVQPQQFSVQVSPETLKVTLLGHYAVGSCVNLERAMLATGRLGGHFVSGHVEALAQVQVITVYDDFTSIRVSGISPANLAYLMHKGSVTVNGVSLTVNQVTSDGFELMLVPHTLSRTSLSQLQVGSAVQVEFDMLAKMVERQLQLREEVV